MRIIRSLGQSLVCRWWKI